MKIRKFNENTNDDIFEYIQECFIDFVDAGSLLVNDEGYIHIIIKAPSYSNGENYIDDRYLDIFENVKKLDSILDEIQVCLERVRCRYKSLFR